MNKYIPFIGGRRKTINKILSLTFLISGLISGLILVRQNQEMREKAETICPWENNGFCGQGAGCPKGYMCNQGRCVQHDACNYDYCPATDCNLPVSISGAIYCILSTNGKLTTCCPENKPLYNSDLYQCTTSSSIVPPNNSSPPSTNTCGCSSASAAQCQGKDPGDTCKPGKVCKDSGQVGNDGKPKCTCSDSSSSNNNGGEECDNYNENPSSFDDIDSSGELTLHIKNPEEYLLDIALKKNTDECGLTDNDVKFQTTKTDMESIPTGLSVSSGDEVCIYIEHAEKPDNNTYPAAGWDSPDGNECGRVSTTLDISDLMDLAGDSIVGEAQCWGDYAESESDCDFEDFAVVFSLGGVVNTEGITIKFRQQGITTLPESTIQDQFKVDVAFKDGNSAVHEMAGALASVDENGIWTVAVEEDDKGNLITTGIYDILIKGFSHLAKKFLNVDIAGTDVLIDRSTNQEDELRCADVNEDNLLTIEDVALVSSFYTDFSIPVNSPNMYTSDINKDGRITVDDLALVVYNWSDFTIPGDK